MNRRSFLQSLGLILIAPAVLARAVTTVKPVPALRGFRANSLVIDDDCGPSPKQWELAQCQRHYDVHCSSEFATKLRSLTYNGKAVQGLSTIATSSS